MWSPTCSRATAAAAGADRAGRGLRPRRVHQPDGDLRTLPCQLPDPDSRLAGLDGFYAARLAEHSGLIHLAPQLAAACGPSLSCCGTGAGIAGSKGRAPDDGARFGSRITRSCPWLLLRGGLRRLAGRAQRPSAAALVVLPLKPDRLLIAPQDLRTADATRASEIYAGRFAFAGKIVVCDGRSLFEMEPPSEEWAVALLGFSWLRHLRAAESAITRANARALIDEWITLQGSWHPLGWRPDVLSRRIISWLSQATLRAGRRRRRASTAASCAAWSARCAICATPPSDARRGVARLQALIALTYAALCIAGQGEAHQVDHRAAQSQ